MQTFLHQCKHFCTGAKLFPPVQKFCTGAYIAPVRCLHPSHRFYFYFSLNHVSATSIWMAAICRNVVCFYFSCHYIGWKLTLTGFLISRLKHVISLLNLRSDVKSVGGCFMLLAYISMTFHADAYTNWFASITGCVIIFARCPCFCDLIGQWIWNTL